MIDEPEAGRLSPATTPKAEDVIRKAAGETKADFDVIATGYGLLEGPTLLGDDAILVSDVHQGGVHRIDLDTGEGVVVHPFRRGIGGIALHVDGFVMTGRDVTVRSVEPDGEFRMTLLERDEESGILGYNDLVTDVRGELLVGSIGFEVSAGYRRDRPGTLFRIRLDGQSDVLDDDVLLPNGLALSSDGRNLYACDSLRGVIFRYILAEDGSVVEREPFWEFDKGKLDGVAIAEDGSLWVAVAEYGAVAVIAENGALVALHEFPISMITSVCFGISARSPVIFITTGGASEDSALGGALLRMDSPVRGSRPHVAKVRGA